MVIQDTEMVFQQCHISQFPKGRRRGLNLSRTSFLFQKKEQKIKGNSDPKDKSWNNHTTTRYYYISIRLDIKAS